MVGVRCQIEREIFGRFEDELDAMFQSIYTVHGCVRIDRLHSVTIKPEYFHTNEFHFHTSANHKAYTLVLICGCIMPWCKIIKISA
jgi:hypothetical protein